MVFNFLYKVFGIKPSPSEQTALREKASLLLEQGNVFEAEENFKEAMRCYKSALNMEPSFARAHLNLGNALLATGKFDSALSEYAIALNKDPKYAAAYLNIGNAYMGNGQPAQALQSYLKAIELKPDFSEAHAAQGYSYEELGRRGEAIEAYRRALDITPNHLQIQHNLGNALVAEGRNEEAIVLFRQMHEMHPDDIQSISGLTRLQEALAQHEELINTIRQFLNRHPESPEAHNNLGIALLAAGRPDQARASHLHALRLNPKFAEAYFCLGSCQQKQGLIDDAMDNYRKALELDPTSLKTVSNLGNLLMDENRPDEAASIFKQGLSLRPDLPEAHFNLGTALSKLGQLEKAEICFYKALALKPNFANAYNNLGACLNHKGMFQEALKNFRHALELDPALYQAQSNMGLALQDLGRLEEAKTCFLKALEINPGFGEATLNLALTYSSLGQLDQALNGVRQAIDLMPDNIQAHSSLLFLHNYRNDASPTQLFDEALRYGKLVAAKAQTSASFAHFPAEPNKCLNIGLVSGDLRRHPVGFFVEGVLAALATQAQDRLRIFAYSASFQNDAVTDRIKRSLYKWTSITGISDEVAYERICADKIDILIDLSGHTLYSRLPLFAWRPAPVQVTWLGYFATTGVEAVDYLIADPWTLPESQEAYFTEEIIRLPETRLCFTPPDESVQSGPLPALRNGHVTFGCFNTLTKINDDVVALWSQILKALPNSRLMLMSHQLQEKAVVQRTFDRFKEHGINKNRLEFKGFAPRSEYFLTYNQIDIALDPFPYCGGTTTVEALWMGVPVITLAGEHFLARQGVGLMMNAGLPEWVADSPNHYISLALKHAGELEKLAQLRAGLRSQVLSSPIFDAPRFAVHFEATLRTTWKKWCLKQNGM